MQFGPLLAIYLVPQIHGISPEVLRVAGVDADSDALSLISLSSRVTPGGQMSALSGDSVTAAARLRQALPFAWLHVPKCGSSIANFLVDLPGVCPGVPLDLVIDNDTFGENHIDNFEVGYGVLNDTGACGPNFKQWGKHFGAGPKWDSVYQGHAFMFLRQPEQRVLSAFHYHHAGWPFEGERLPKDEREYAEVMQGCAVRMITGGGKNSTQSCAGNGTSGPPTDEQVKLAVHRVRTGMAFVGITEQWAMSICLGHKMFGGACRFSDFVNNRVTDRTDIDAIASTKVGPTKPYDLAPLRGFTDKYDGELYAAALEVFEEEKERYGVTPESCQPCFDEAGVTVELL